jgi:hypothetical protein
MFIEHLGHRMLCQRTFAVALAAGMAIAPSVSRADVVLFDQLFVATGASAEFVADGTTHQLTITLTNSSTTTSNSDLLDGLFFSISGNPVLTPAPSGTNNVSLPTASASQLLTSSDNGKTVNESTGAANITGAWQLKQSGFTFNSTAYKYGLSAVGANVFASKDFTLGNGSDDYGLVGSGTNLSKKFATQFPLAIGTITFTLGLPTDFTGGEVEDAAFGYNSELSEVIAAVDPPVPSAAPIPEPASLALFGIGLVSLVAMRRRRDA